MNTVILDETGYPKGQKEVKFTLSCGREGFLLRRESPIPTVILEGIAFLPPLDIPTVLSNIRGLADMEFHVWNPNFGYTKFFPEQ